MKRKAKIYYTSLDDFWRKEEKLNWLSDNPISKIEFDRIEPDAKSNWINQTDNDWDSLMPLIDKDVKAGKSEEAIFKLFSRGLETNRQDWSYSFSKSELEEKTIYSIDIYNKSLEQSNISDKPIFDNLIKWSRELERHLKNKIRIKFVKENVYKGFLKPYCKSYVYLNKYMNSYIYDWDKFVEDKSKPKNLFIGLNNGSIKFASLAFENVIDQATMIVGGGSTQCLPFYYYSNDERFENITDWALNQFQINYKESNGAKITKQDIFYYVYAVLHSPVYRKKYEQNLKREFPRLPFYDDFFQWCDWGAELMDLHINYETQSPFALGRNDLKLTAKQQIKQENLFGGKENADDEPFIPAPKTKLRADKEQEIIEIDSHTTLTGVPPLAWEYKLGNRSAIEWILDQYKEKTPRDATIAERFNTYKFEDYKESVIDLIMRVTTVSVKTMEIINQMPNN